ncbi:anthranilate phosphoribosyltransferase [Megasphaera cerevisiae DSM 20462]|uniref:Anthranilate phosphoribosyltransferase n=1 Tax=Megasphaera cerevisiae DSM 20462 TaxID=1122219 RepID=A0A0J6WZH3_9FIRM|nr:anthranilate phosphoribosyltransferase [Megasphaera cerevisiae]KMO87287.1 anthranilate phosphoribosyltransferase [Megasphaera cerevisiae DSM 20462]SJZ48810.1 anthranilate phosphoribosyltransferase [Megasphaera cerevisiae DSM 20462]
MIQEATVKLIRHENLTMEDTMQVIDEIMGGQTTPVQTAAFLTALQAKGATITEITACAKSMRDHATPVSGTKGLLEIVGTGGDQSQSFNISTTSSFVCAAGGCKVAKHGNRAATSKSGAADVLEALGANISLDPDKCTALLQKVGFCFLFAQHYHKAMKYVGPVRKELGVPTVFNLLGPLTNPAHADHQVLGVYDESLVEPLAHVLSGLGVKRGMAVYGMDKMDEISASAPTKICEFDGDTFTTYEIEPEQFQLIRGSKSEVVGGTPAENADITRQILSGKPGTKRVAVVLNAGAGLYIAGKAPTLEAGVRMAERLIDSGEALNVLNAFVVQSHIA